MSGQAGRADEVGLAFQQFLCSGRAAAQRARRAASKAADQALTWRPRSFHSSWPLRLHSCSGPLACHSCRVVSHCHQRLGQHKRFSGLPSAYRPLTNESCSQAKLWRKGCVQSECEISEGHVRMPSDADSARGTQPGNVAPGVAEAGAYEGHLHGQQSLGVKQQSHQMSETGSGACRITFCHSQVSAAAGAVTERSGDGRHRHVWQRLVNSSCH